MLKWSTDKQTSRPTKELQSNPSILHFSTLYGRNNDTPVSLSLRIYFFFFFLDIQHLHALCMELFHFWAFPSCCRELWNHCVSTFTACCSLFREELLPLVYCFLKHGRRLSSPQTAVSPISLFCVMKTENSSWNIRSWNMQIHDDISKFLSGFCHGLVPWTTWSFGQLL